MNNKTIISLSILSVLSFNAFAYGVEDLPKDSNGLLIPQSRILSLYEIEHRLLSLHKKFDSETTTINNNISNIETVQHNFFSDQGTNIVTAKDINNNLSSIAEIKNFNDDIDERVTKLESNNHVSSNDILDVNMKPNSFCMKTLNDCVNNSAREVGINHVAIVGLQQEVNEIKAASINQNTDTRISHINNNAKDKQEILIMKNTKGIIDLNNDVKKINSNLISNKQTEVEIGELKDKVNDVTNDLTDISTDSKNSLKVSSDNKIKVETLNSNMETVNVNIEKVEDNVGSLGVKVDDINSQFQINKDIVDAIKNNVDSIGTTVKSNKHQMIDNKNSIKQIDTDILSIDNRSHINENKIKVLDGQQDIIESKANQALNTSKKLSVDFKTLSHKSIDNSNSITRVNENINSIKEEVNNKYNTIESEQKTIKSNIESNKKSIDLNKEDIKQTKQIVNDNTVGIVRNNNQIKEIYSIVGEDKSHGLQADINNNKQNIKELSDKFKEMAKDYNEYKEKTNGAIAGVAAMGQLAQPFGVHQFTSGFAMGSYDGATALAVGVGYRANTYLTMRAAVSANSADNMSPVIAGSINYEW